jgi:hypothetical protein
MHAVFIAAWTNAQSSCRDLLLLASNLEVAATCEMVQLLVALDANGRNGTKRDRGSLVCGIF